MSKQHDRKRRKKVAAKTRRRTRLQTKQNLNRTTEQLLSVFGEHSEEFLTLASEGAAPEEIADKLNVPVKTVDKFIDAFSNLPGGIDKQLQRASSLLSKQNSVQLLLKSAIQEAKNVRRHRPY